MDFGERLKLFAKERFEGVGKFAEEVGLHPSAVSRYINGGSQPTKDILSKFAQAGLNIHWLLTGEGDMDAPRSGGLVMDTTSPTGTYAGERPLADEPDLSDPEAMLKQIDRTESDIHALLGVMKELIARQQEEGENEQ